MALKPSSAPAPPANHPTSRARQFVLILNGRSRMVEERVGCSPPRRPVPSRAAHAPSPAQPAHLSAPSGPALASSHPPRSSSSSLDCDASTGEGSRMRYPSRPHLCRYPRSRCCPLSSAAGAAPTPLAPPAEQTISTVSTEPSHAFASGFAVPSRDHPLSRLQAVPRPAHRPRPAASSA